MSHECTCGSPPPIPLLAVVEALRFYTAERGPLDYARTQNNLQRALKDLGTDAGTTRRLAPARHEGRGRVWRWVWVIQRPDPGSR
jgi:hypothetical protein